MTTDEAALDKYLLSDAAYILGALSPDERREYETHLQDCAACRSSVGEIAGLPALMSAVSLDHLTGQAEGLPETLLPSLARAVRRERGRRRLAVGAAAVAAACLIAVSVVAITRPDSPARPLVGSSTSTPSKSANLALTAVVRSPVTASARLVEMAWGTRIDLTCAYRSQHLYSNGFNGKGFNGKGFNGKGFNGKGFNSEGPNPANGIPYALVVIDRHGAAEQVATWKALPDRELTIMGATSRARADIAAVEIRTLSGRAILRLST
jgi:hypothetical protein